MLAILMDAGPLTALLNPDLNEEARVFTLDADFRIYRRHRSKIIPVLMPDDQTPGGHLAETPLPYRVKRRPGTRS